MEKTIPYPIENNRDRFYLIFKRTHAGEFCVGILFINLCTLGIQKKYETKESYSKRKVRRELIFLPVTKNMYRLFSMDLKCYTMLHH